jgi:hypothetical protein
MVLNNITGNATTNRYIYEQTTVVTTCVFLLVVSPIGLASWYIVKSLFLASQQVTWDNTRCASARFIPQNSACVTPRKSASAGKKCLRRESKSDIGYSHNYCMGATSRSAPD